MSQKPSKFIYQEIVSKNCERPISFKKSGAKTSIFCQRKLLIGNSLIRHPFNAQRAVNLSLSTSNCYIAGYQLTVSLKKSDLRMMTSALFLIRKQKTSCTYFGDAKKKQNFGIVFLSGCSLPNFRWVNTITYT